MLKSDDSKTQTQVLIDKLRNPKKIRDSLDLSKNNLQTELSIAKEEKQKYLRNTEDSEKVKSIKLKVYDEIISDIEEYIKENYSGN